MCGPTAKDLKKILDFEIQSIIPSTMAASGKQQKSSESSSQQYQWQQHQWQQQQQQQQPRVNFLFPLTAFRESVKILLCSMDLSTNSSTLPMTSSSCSSILGAAVATVSLISEIESKKDEEGRRRQWLFQSLFQFSKVSRASTIGKSMASLRK